ncbi:Hypothetical protein HDN1F_13040 [gamma proteobacterium HdN1]|nr:Hypothetical protein HDN1F_13040 [gamma proteobacterium HdN1]
MTAFTARQATLQRQLSTVREIHARHDLNASRIEELAPLIEHFEIRVPLIGSFSCGKSSLINALLGENLLATAITPETAVPAELYYGPVRTFLGCMPDGRRLVLSEVDLRDNRLERLLPAGWVEARLSNPALAKRQQLVLVDLPGWDSGIEAHESVIDNYAHRSLAYCVVVNVEDGGLRDSLRFALSELAIAKMPIVLIISKADKKTPDDVQAVVERLVADITALMGRSPLAVATTSSRKKDSAKLESALDTLQAQAGEIFETRIVGAYRSHLQHTAQHLSLLANQDNSDAARLQADIDNLEQKILAFDAHLQKETAALQARIGPILETVHVRVENALGGRVEALASQLLRGLNISDDVLGTVRLIASESLRKEFEPAMQAYLERVEDALPSRIDFNFGFAPQTGTSGKQSGEFPWKNLATGLVPLLVRFTNPVVMIISHLLPILGALFDGMGEQKRRQIEEARQRELARGQVHEALNQVVQQIDAQLRPVLSAQVQKAQKEVAQNVSVERDEFKKTLTTLAKALQQGEDEAAALRQRAQVDLDLLNAMLAELEPTA